jgi:hypothetical protein
MADYDSSLPIRTEADGTDERLHSKLVDYTDPGGTDKQLEISEKKAHVRNHSKDSDGNDQEQLLSQEGHSLTNGDYDATNNKRPSSQGLITSDRSASPAETTMNKRPTAVAGDNDKTALDCAISDSDGNHFGENNPLAVYLAESPAEEIVDYNESVDIAKDATGNHDYTVTALKSLKSIEAFGSASGKARFELQIETGVGAGTFTTAMVKFNSTAEPNVSFKYKKAVAAGVIVRLAKTNLDNQAQSLYSQIMGVEI